MYAGNYEFYLTKLLIIFIRVSHKKFKLAGEFKYNHNFLNNSLYIRLFYCFLKLVKILV